MVIISNAATKSHQAASSERLPRPACVLKSDSPVLMRVDKRPLYACAELYVHQIQPHYLAPDTPPPISSVPWKIMTVAMQTCIPRGRDSQWPIRMAMWVNTHCFSTDLRVVRALTVRRRRNIWLCQESNQSNKGNLPKKSLAFHSNLQTSPTTHP